MPQINQPLLYVYKKLASIPTHASSLAPPHAMLCTSMRSTTPDSNCSLSDSINFLLPGISRECYV